MKTHPKLGLITNSTNVTLESELDGYFRSAQEVCIATAFINKDALKHLISYLENKRNKVRYLRLLVGLYGRFNSPEVLSELMDIQSRYTTTCQIRIARNLRFHWKCYFIDTGVNQVSFIGSANFTTNGISESGEMVTRFVEKKNGAFSHNLRHEFDKLFSDEEESFNILKLPLEEYRDIYQPPPPKSRKSDSKLAALLKKPFKKETAESRSFGEAKARLIIFTGYSSLKTENIIAKYKSKWSRLNYEYTCFGRKSDYDKARNADLLFYQDKNDNDEWTFTFYEVKDSEPIETPDGKYFVAYQKVKGCRVIHISKLENKLKELGVAIKKRGPFKDRNLGSRQLQELLKAFKIEK